MIPTLLEWAEDGSIKISPHLLSYPEINELWKRDKTRDKNVVRRELTLIFGLLSPTIDNPWYAIPKKDRFEAINRDLFGGEYKPDAKFKKAFEVIKKMQVKLPEEKLLDSYEELINKVTNFIKKIDLAETDKYGRPVYGPQVLDFVKKNEEAMETLERLRRKLIEKREELDDGKELKLFELNNPLDEKLF